ncbi:MAG: hypothetical protein J0H09_29785 [Burkholderiales bacterium]|nr:hypothetical protein [Burkholderiales bacterium]
MTDDLEPISCPELVFGLIGPSGTDLPSVCSVIHRQLERFHYKIELIKLSKLIEQFAGLDGNEPEHERIWKLMDAGGAVREQSRRGDAVALLAISEIHRIRAENPERKGIRTAYILDSLKHPDEVHLLRTVYGAGFFVVAAYSPRQDRIEALAERLARSMASESSASRSQAERIVYRDEKEERTKLGQNVAGTFPLADVFVDCQSRSQLTKHIERFVDLIFSHPFRTPTRDEYAMFHAMAASLRSSDLNRQVGAVIATPDGDVIAGGCNDVPKPGGGLYWEEDEPDVRDFQIGRDAMYEYREQILYSIIDRLSEAKLLDASAASDKKGLTKSLLEGEQKAVLEGSRLLGLLEFGRPVHAEMAALMDAARRGVSVRGNILYCTTFPCHLCARHIVAAGVARVVYIQPYPKSRASHMYRDSIVVDEKRKSEGRVVFEPFVGIAPRQFVQMFESLGEARKDSSGNATQFDPSTAGVRFFRQGGHAIMETRIIATLLKTAWEEILRARSAKPRGDQ